MVPDTLALYCALRTVTHTPSQVLFHKLKYFYQLSIILSQRDILTPLAASSDFAYAS